jgi:hypothetical protein
VFATNAILCLKAGTASEMSARVKQVWFRQCRPFIRRTLDAVQAPVVIALGKRAFVSTALAFGVKPTPFLLAVEKASRSCSTAGKAFSRSIIRPHGR